MDIFWSLLAHFPSENRFSHIFLASAVKTRMFDSTRQRSSLLPQVRPSCLCYPPPLAHPWWKFCLQEVLQRKGWSRDPHLIGGAGRMRGLLWRQPRRRKSKWWSLGEEVWGRPRPAQRSQWWAAQCSGPKTRSPRPLLSAWRAMVVVGKRTRHKNLIVSESWGPCKDYTMHSALPFLHIIF